MTIYHPWPMEADGSGSTLELINPDLDNSVTSNWKSSIGFGTPGEINSTFITGIEETKERIPKSYSLFQNYPNPFNPATIIKYSIPLVVNENYNSQLQLKIYDVLGREVKTLVNQNQKPGNYEISFDAT